ncbi:MAG: terminase [Lentisphaerae bacterium GWF2_44_16]|nr:MAG: terminase [Lentisphaerae bacterium GWF2_44_16]
MEIKLHPKQSKAFKSTATEILYGGAAGGGKSHLIRVKPCALAMMIPKLQVYLFRRRYDDILKNHFEGPGSFPELLSDFMPKYCRISYQNPPRIRFANGSVIHVCHCQHEKDRFNYQGAEIHVLLIDELTHFTEKIYRYIRSRCRVSDKMKIPKGIKLPLVLCGSNPGGVGHNWVKASWIDNADPFEIRQMPKEEGGMLRQYIPAKLQDNPSLNEEEYRAQLSGLGNPYLVKAMLEGSWDIVAGGMFDDLWNPAVHVVEPFAIPKTWRIDRSFDWGSSKPYSVGWWASSDGSDIVLADGTRRSTLKGDLFRIAEYYGWNGQPNTGTKETAVDVARKIIKMEKEMQFNVRPGPADNSIYDVNNGNCIADDMARAGVRWERSDKSPGSRKNGWELMRQRLKASIERCDPGLFVFSTCRNFIRTIPVLPRDEKESDDIDTEAEDHIADEARYRVLAQSKSVSSGSVIGMY